MGQFRFAIALAGLCLSWAVPAQAEMPALIGLPAPIVTQTEDYTSYALPTAPFQDRYIPSLAFEGRLSKAAYRINKRNLSTLELLAPLREQLGTLGYDIVFECKDTGCGGFDFRFQIGALPEPEMHVDLGDYRFLAAQRGPEAVSLIVSRSAEAGFVQLTQLEPSPVKASPAPQPSAASTAATPAATPTPPQGENGPLGAALAGQGHVALDDLVFNSGSSSLASGDYTSLHALADWLATNPQSTIALVGHTDASGGLEANIALSRKRAEAVRQVLLREFNLPAARLSAQGVGPLAPRASNQSPEGREANRRVEAILTSITDTP